MSDPTDRDGLNAFVIVSRALPGTECSCAAEVSPHDARFDLEWYEGSLHACARSFEQVFEQAIERQMVGRADELR